MRFGKYRCVLVRSRASMDRYWSERFLLKVYIVLLFLDHIRYRRAHFIHVASCVTCVLATTCDKPATKNFCLFSIPAWSVPTGIYQFLGPVLIKYITGPCWSFQTSTARTDIYKVSLVPQTIRLPSRSNQFPLLKVQRMVLLCLPHWWELLCFRHLRKSFFAWCFTQKK